VELYHGPFVEVRDQWCVEGVWPASFAEGDFDKADLFFGSGLRIRDNQIVVVSSHSTFSRILRLERSNEIILSNSLPALLAISGANLIPDFLGYRERLNQLKLGRKYFDWSIPILEGEIRYTLILNLLIEDGKVSLVEKPDLAPSFKSFSDYHTYLVEQMRALGRNFIDPARKQIFLSCSSLSSGYDSATAAALSREAGCKTAFTIDRARSFYQLSDSGEEIAHYLGMTAEVYQRTPENFRFEESIWAVMGDAQDLNLAIFDYQPPLSVNFTGFYGDILWELGWYHSQPVEELFRDDTSGMTFCEQRLFSGVVQVPIAQWAYRHGSEIRAISALPEMEPWTLNTEYDRPICRRILETAGVPRGKFALRKKATAISDERLWPYSIEAQADFESFLRERYQITWGELILARTSIWVNGFDRNIIGRLRERLKLSPNLTLEYQARPNRLLFHWGNARLVERYQRGLPKLSVNSSDHSLGAI